MEIHPSFLQKKKRRSNYDMKLDILELLNNGDKSLTSLYQQLGYSGNPSNSFRQVVKQLLEDEFIVYSERRKINSSKNVLKINKKK